MTYDSRPQNQVPANGGGFFGWVRNMGLVRDNGWLGGVCGGIAERLGINPTIVRVITVILAFFAGSAILLYLAAWLILPDRNDHIHLEHLMNGKTGS
jgi:phage shock protein PspC (stress-responsive transcriptional regulator)